MTHALYNTLILLDARCHSKGNSGGAWPHFPGVKTLIGHLAFARWISLPPSLLRRGRNGFFSQREHRKEQPGISGKVSPFPNICIIRRGGNWSPLPSFSVNLNSYQRWGVGFKAEGILFESRGVLPPHTCSP